MRSCPKEFRPSFHSLLKKFKPSPHPDWNWFPQRLHDLEAGELGTARTFLFLFKPKAMDLKTSTQKANKDLINCGFFINISPPHTLSLPLSRQPLHKNIHSPTVHQLFLSYWHTLCGIQSCQSACLLQYSALPGLTATRSCHRVGMCKGKRLSGRGSPR